jgi:hypothetical protein
LTTACRAEYNNNEEGSVTITNAPGDWVKTFQANGKIGRKATLALAYEHLLRLGGNLLPLWTGVITKQMIFLLMWDGIKPNDMASTIKLMRRILMAHAKVAWRWSNRCETVYSSENENEKRRVQRTRRKAAMEVLQELGADIRLWRK